jgi:hypothetical protein
MDTGDPGSNGAIGDRAASLENDALTDWEPYELPEDSDEPPEEPWWDR